MFSEHKAIPVFMLALRGLIEPHCLLSIHYPRSGLMRDLMMFKKFGSVLLLVTLVAFTGCDNKKATPAQNAQPQGDQQSYSKDQNNMKVKGRKMPAPPPIEPVTPP